MQVHVITKSNAYLYPLELEQFFRIRHQIYAVDLQWVPQSPDGLERDQFDIDEAVYLLGIVDGTVVTGSRFTPTHLPHMLSEVFPHLCTRNGGIIRSPAVAEWTRGFVIPRFREGLGVRLKAQFCHAVMQYFIEEGVTTIGGIQEVYWLALWRRFGWEVSVRGEPEDFNGRAWVPAYFEVTEEAAIGAARWGKIERSILVRRGEQMPFIAFSRSITQEGGRDSAQASSRL
jgi:acyl-homoserine lactone synthase